MQYFVVGDDGSKYGPADVATLQSWANENRINSQTQLEAPDGTRVAASSLLTFAAPASPAASSPTMSPPREAVAPQNPYAQAPGQFAQYPRQGAYSGDDGSGDITKAWIFGAIGLLCCPIIFSSLGIYYGNLAEKKGNPGGKNAKIFSICTLIIGIIIGISLRGLAFAARS